ncbi:MAG: ankyrin repeat domain-containing protein [Lactobacillales bacterium]|jgi:ankyrin repeat protein|nr:ankyrin repeat domain-containing protein [Lactobacillales bacterium]
MIKKKYKILFATAFAFLSLSLANQIQAEPRAYKKNDPVSKLTESMVPNPFQGMSDKALAATFSRDLSVIVKKGKFAEAATFTIDPDLQTIKLATSRKIYSYATGQLIEFQVAPKKEELLGQLEQAIKDDNPQKLQEILAWEGNVFDINNDLFSNGANALQYAIHFGKQKTAKLLIWHPSVDINKKNLTDDISPLFLAVHFKQAKIVRSLTQCGKTLNIDEPCVTEEVNPLMLAVMLDCIDIVKILIEKNADINWHLPNSLITPLTCAISTNKTEIALYLINQQDCDLNWHNIDRDNGNLALFSAICEKNLPVVERLINDERLQTSFHCEFLTAIQDKSFSIVKLLLDSGKVHLTDTMLDLARSNFNSEISEISETLALLENQFLPRQTEEESSEESEPDPEPPAAPEDIADDQQALAEPAPVRSDTEPQPRITFDPSSEPEVGTDSQQAVPDSEESSEPEIPSEEEEDVSEPVVIPASESQQPQPRVTPPTLAPRRRRQIARQIFDTVRFVNNQFAQWQAVGERYNGGRNLSFITLDMHTQGVSVDPNAYAETFVNTTFERLGEILYTGELTLVTGRGRHSRVRGFSPVKEATIANLNALGINFQPDPNNPGKILIQFRGGQPIRA